MTTIEIDLTYYERVACCILGTASVLLEDAGLPVPARAAIVDAGQLGNPSCCEALLVTPGRSLSRLEDGRKCGPKEKIVEWELRIFRDACTAEHECGEEGESNCFDLGGWCPGDPFPEQPEDACTPLGREWSRRLRLADRALLESPLFAAEVDACLCAVELFGCDSICSLSCATPTEWYETARSSGGGCAGSILKFRTHTIGA